MIRCRAFFAHQRGAAAAEFALVLPVALLFLLGTIDMGRYMWAMNRLEKAVQFGTRYAVTTDIVPEGLNAEDYSAFACSAGTLNSGDPICREALGTITCTNAASCTCEPSALGNASCPSDLTANTVAFDNIVGRMRVVDAGISPANVSVKYSGSGIGYAGDPITDDGGADLSEISPIVTVEVASFRFRSMSLLGLGIRLPGFRYSQTLEDGDGAVAY